MSFPLNVVVRAGEQAADSFFLLHPLFLPSSSPCIAAKAANEICFANGILHKSKRFLPSRSNHLDRLRNRIIVFVIRIREIFYFTNRILAREKIERSEQRAERENESTRNRSISPRESPYSASLFIKHSDCRVYQRLFANTPSGNRISGNGSTVGRRKTVG